jgi:hypothetical protein
MLNAVDRQFVQEHLNDDLHRLLLSAHRFPGISVPAAVGQIEAMRKVRSKIPSWFRFDLEFPPALSVEQASSEQTAQFKASLLTGNKMADLTGGMGVDTFFFAQHFKQATYLEQNSELADLARHNFGVLRATNIQVVTLPAEDFINQNTDHFDLIYIDPARRGDRQQRVFRLEDCSPDILAIKDRLLETSDRVLLKTAPLLDLNLAVEQLQSVVHIWVVSVDNEVKEVLYLLEKSAPAIGNIPIEAVCLGEVPRFFSCTRLEEQAAPPPYAPPQRYLYEPDAAVLKAGAFKSFARRFGLNKLHPNTHLYTSETFVPDVPGRSFTIETVLRYDRKAVQQAIPGKKANVAVRNFPDSVEQVRQKLGLMDGGDLFLFGTTDLEERKILVLGRRAP